MSAGGFEQVAVERGRRSGCAMAVAVHSTVLGPALGGARLWHYDADADAVDDAKRLAQAMTMKAAAAGLDLGGGKGVIAAPAGPAPTGELRRGMLLDFGDLVESLDGSYVTAEDVGTGADDMAVIAERTRHVVGLDSARGGSGDPSPITALGVLAAIHACAEHYYGTRDLTDLRACVIGLGHVGAELAGMLTRAGAKLFASDIDPSRRAVIERIGARWIDPDRAMTTGCEILAPCALGGVIGLADVPGLRAAIVCGAANNVLTDDAVAEAMARRGVLYAPDFIANAGGLISVYGELRGLPPERAMELARGIEGEMGKVLALARDRGTTPLRAARRIALERLDRGVPDATSAPARRPRSPGHRSLRERRHTTVT